MCYNIIKYSNNPYTLNFVNLNKKLNEYLIQKQHIDNWIINREEKSLEKIINETNRNDFIYLSPDSPLKLTEFIPSKYYIIGCLVDNKILKN